MKQQVRQSGFGTTLLIAIVLVITILSVTGVLVYQRKKPVIITNNTAVSQSPSPSPAPTQQTGATLDIKEWGVHLTLDSTTASMYYSFNPDVPDVAYVSLKAVSNIAPNCAADKGSLGAISRLTDAQQQQLLAFAAHPSGPPLGPPATIHIGNYWYSVETSHADCTNNATQRTTISQTLPSYNPGEILKTLNTLAAD